MFMKFKSRITCLPTIEGRCQSSVAHACMHVKAYLDWKWKKWDWEEMDKNLHPMDKPHVLASIGTTTASTSNHSPRLRIKMPIHRPSSSHVETGEGPAPGRPVLCLRGGGRRARGAGGWHGREEDFGGGRDMRRETVGLGNTDRAGERRQQPCVRGWAPWAVRNACLTLSYENGPTHPTPGFGDYLGLHPP